MRTSLLRCLPVVVLVVLLLAGDVGALAVGDKAPDFTLPAAGREQPVKLADLLGKGPVVVYTFIQAFTPA